SKDSVISKDVCSDNKKPSARAHNLSPGRYSSFGQRTQITDGQIHCSHLLTRRQESDYGEGHGGVDQRSDGTAMNNSVVLFQFFANVQPESCNALANVVKFDPKQMSVGNRINRFLNSSSLRGC